jgi:glutathione S-transferase
VIELFQITGSCSFAARAALEEAGAPYTPIDIHPRRRDEPASFGVVNPLRRVPALREGAVTVYETGAVLLWIGDRFPETGLAPPINAPTRGAYYRWMVWLADTLHPAWGNLLRGQPDALSRERMDAHAAYLERELQRGWCLGDRYSLADTYLYMLVGWRSYVDGYSFAAPAVDAHYARVGARPAIRRTRELDDLRPDLLRYNPTMRAGKPLS